MTTRQPHSDHAAEPHSDHAPHTQVSQVVRRTR